MITCGDVLPDLPCYVHGSSARTLHAIGGGEHLVLYLRGAGVTGRLVDQVSLWPLPTWPVTTFATVDHENGNHGYLRTLSVDDC